MPRPKLPVVPKRLEVRHGAFVNRKVRPVALCPRLEVFQAGKEARPARLPAVVCGARPAVNTSLAVVIICEVPQAQGSRLPGVCPQVLQACAQGRLELVLVRVALLRAAVLPELARADVDDVAWIRTAQPLAEPCRRDF